MKLLSILGEYDIDIQNTKIIRHPYNKPDVKKIYDAGYIESYQCEQGNAVFDNCKYILAFLGTSNTNAIFIGCYEIGRRYEGEDKKKMMPLGFPFPEYFEHGYYYEMVKTDIMSDLEKRLVIDWGKSTRSWHQWASNNKDVIAIYSPRNMREVKEFKSYEETVLSFSELQTIVNDPVTYEDWYLSLKNVNGVYLICDTVGDKLYIGSTYNDEGIWGRWKCYIETHDGGDEGIKELLAEKENKNAYLHFQFSILRTLSKTVLPEEAISIENLYKKKLHTKNGKYGLNQN